jgi:multiple sugar transport system permease protein
VRAQHERRQTSVGPAREGLDFWRLAPPFAAGVLATVALWAGSGRSRVWLAPAIVLTAVALLYPIFELVRLALTDASAPGSPYSYTLHGFRALLGDPQFYGMLAVTLIFVACSVALQLGLGLAMAWLFDAAERRKVMGSLAARVAVVAAWVVPGVLVGVIWKILLIENRSGIVNYWLSRLGVGPVPLLSSGGLALMSVIIANTWRGCAFSMLLQYAGLRRIPLELHEAADLEGVSAWQRLRWLIVPQLAPVIVLNLLLVTIYTFNTFDLILPLTGGGPARRTEVVSLYMYRSAFFDLESGKAAAVAVVMLVVNGLLAWGAARLILPGRRPAQEAR